jgi:hypothetical protein
VKEVKVVKRNDIDKYQIALEAIKRQREEMADMKRRLLGVLAAWDKKITGIEDFLKGH